MKTKELIQWCFNAKNIHEDSWSELTNSYQLTYKQALEKTEPTPIITPLDRELSEHLLESAWHKLGKWYLT